MTRIYAGLIGIAIGLALLPVLHRLRMRETLVDRYREACR